MAITSVKDDWDTPFCSSTIFFKKTPIFVSQLSPKDWITVDLDYLKFQHTYQEITRKVRSKTYKITNQMKPITRKLQEKWIQQLT